MSERWIPLQQYKLLRPSDDAEAAVDIMPSVRFSDWFALRRVRTAFTVAALLLVGFLLSRSVKLSAPRQDTGMSSLHPSSSSPATGDNGVRWSNFAYVQYITNGNYLCNSLMILEALHRSGAKADRVMMYPEEWKISEDNAPDDSTESKLLLRARDLYEAKLVPIKVQTLTQGDATWKDSYTKLLAFNQTQYKRVMSLDSDATVRQVSALLDRSPSFLISTS
jgi:alpha-N-acetylglucosamine transferase